MLATPAHCLKGDADALHPSCSDLYADVEGRQGAPECQSLLVIGEFAPDGLIKDLSSDQLSAWRMQSMSGFAQTDLLDPAEDVWNHV